MTDQLGPKHALERLGFNINSPLALIQEVRVLIEGSPTPKDKAWELIKQISGVDRTYPSLIDSIHIAQSVCQAALHLDDQFDGEQAIKNAEALVAGYRKNPAMAFVYRAEEAVPQETREIAGLQVIVKADGKIKKGGKQVIALQLFKEHVVAGGLNNKAFIKILEKELDMSTAGATTYAYNAKKAYEHEIGKPYEMAKSPKGGKA